MNPIDIQKLKTNITLRYTLAISIIAVLSTFAFYSLQSALSGSCHTALIVNISGRQRMLSQHIALDAYRVYMAQFVKSSQSIHRLEKFKRQLNDNANEMLKADEMLSTGQFGEKQKMPLSAEVSEMYFGEMQLDSRVREYVALAKNILHAQNAETAYQMLSQINVLSEALLLDLNLAVNQYQQEGEQVLSNVHLTELVNWILTLFVLLIEVVFIFKPMVARIVDLAGSEAKTLESLQGLVDLRTLHLEEANRKLAKLAQQDVLTGLLNRLNMEAEIENAYEQYRQHQIPFAVLMFDIDWFKKVNDLIGHDAGDFALVEVAKLLKTLVRREDHVYRAGGEEFVILLSETPLLQTLAKAKEIRQAVEQAVFVFHEHRIQLTLSGGIYHSELVEAKGVKDILKKVDIALYQSKANGRNCLTEVSAES